EDGTCHHRQQALLQASFVSRISSSVLMVRPGCFGANPETAESNVFQASTSAGDPTDVAFRAGEEFEAAVLTLTEAGVDVAVLDPADPRLTDSVFPNNWFSTHRGGKLVLYPMMAPSRRLERQPERLLAALRQKGGSVQHILDFRSYEDRGLFLEGTGSMVLDRLKMYAYACLSDRTSEEVFREVWGALGYQPVVFEAVEAGVQIYHTNVLMAICEGFAVLCGDSLVTERAPVTDALASSGLEVLEITREQMRSFCGNILQVRTASGEPTTIMSASAREAFTDLQMSRIESYGGVTVCEIPTIELFGGGSIRCMLAEIDL
ncbi:MAG TPA: arginine deiminase-related protein, partial [Fimbriimonadaceae bacterium]|nr:arginine deiminase-related protein [Fimbriimonadaceae bacterium]